MVYIYIYIYIYIYTHTYHIFFVHLSVDGHLDSFHTLAVVDSTAVNIGVHVSLQNSTAVSLGQTPSSEIVGS